MRQQVVIRALDLIIAGRRFLSFCQSSGCSAQFLRPRADPFSFAHQRLGLNGRRFYCLKFCTTVADGEERLAGRLSGDAHARPPCLKNDKPRVDRRTSALACYLRVLDPRRIAPAI